MQHRHSTALRSDAGLQMLCASSEQLLQASLSARGSSRQQGCTCADSDVYVHMHHVMQAVADSGLQQLLTVNRSSSGKNSLGHPCAVPHQLSAPVCMDLLHCTGACQAVALTVTCACAVHAAGAVVVMSHSLSLLHEHQQPLQQCAALFSHIQTFLQGETPTLFRAGCLTHNSRGKG